VTRTAKSLTEPVTDLIYHRAVMSERHTLQCPGCGAPLPKAAVREVVTCVFCGVASTPAPTPSSATAPPAVRIATTRATPSTLACPRCGESLFEGRASSGVVLEGCGECGGIWLENANAQRALQTFDRTLNTLSTQASAHAKREPAVTPRVSCPACNVPMGRTRVANTNIDLDTCAAHGTWFDRGELAAVLDALRPRPAAASSAPIFDAKPLDPSEIPDFRKGTLTPDAADVGIIAGGAFAVLAGLAAIAGGGSK
jgi:Zn-finger nucleic acid-binding protein